MTDVARLAFPALAVHDDTVFTESKMVQDSRAVQFHLLVEIANFAGLRRHVGRARSDLLAADVATRIAASLPDAEIAVAGRAP